MSLRPRQQIDQLAVYEPGRPLDEVARELGLANSQDLVKVASNENPLGPSPKAIEAMCDAASSMHFYPDGGCFYLREALAEKLGIEENQLIFGNGSNELIEFLGHVFLEPGTNIVMSEGAFVVYHLVASSFGAETIQAPMQDFRHDLDAMVQCISDETRLVFVANPNNPTGTAVKPDDLKAFAASLPDHVLLVIDEAYVEIMDRAWQADTLSWLADFPRMLLLRTFSKSYGLAGLRIGYGVGSPDVISLLAKFRQPFNVNAMAQEAAVAALKDGGHVDAFMALVEEGLAYFSREAALLGLETVPSTANFLLIKVGNGRGVFEALQKRGVVVRPMDVYALPEYIRVSVGTMDENMQTMKFLRKVL